VGSRMWFVGQVTQDPEDELKNDGGLQVQ